MSQVVEQTVLQALLDDFVESIDPSALRSIAEWRVGGEAQSMLDQLAEKSNQGALTSQEREHYAAAVRALDILSILRLKARRLLGAAAR
jgi:hypothetical protein